jgi:hypothetical protein
MGYLFFEPFSPDIRYIGDDEKDRLQYLPHVRQRLSGEQ